MNKQNIIVTGGSGLIGKAIVKKLVEKQFHVFNLDLNESESHRDVTFISCDLTQTADVDRIISDFRSQPIKIHGLVNNAYPRTKDWGKSFEEIPMESWRKNVDMQLNAVFYLTQQLMSFLKETKGSIVNIGSIYGVVGNDLSVYEGTNIVPPAAYSAIKGGITNFSRYLSALYGEHGVRVNTVSPGGIFDHQPEPFVEAYEKKVPLRRMGTPEDIGGPVAFLLSEDAKYITGHNLLVDGGWTSI